MKVPLYLAKPSISPTKVLLYLNFYSLKHCFQIEILYLKLVDRGWFIVDTFYSKKNIRKIENV